MRAVTHMSTSNSARSRPGMELVRGDELIVNPASGELLHVHDAETGQLAQARDALIQLRAQINDASRLIDTELAHRLDHDNERSTLVNGYQLTVNAPTATEWDVAKLLETLTELVAEHKLGLGVIEKTLKQEVTYKPAQRELNKLLDHDDEQVRTRIRECRSMVPQRRRVTVVPPPTVEGTIA
jgi:hypothetical protein